MKIFGRELLKLVQERFPASNVLDSNVHCLYNVGYTKKEYIKEQN